MLEPLGAEQRVHQVDEHDQGCRAAEQVFERHLSSAPEPAIDGAGIAQGQSEEDDNGGDENDVKHWLVPGLGLDLVVLGRLFRWPSWRCEDETQQRLNWKWFG